MNDSDLLTRNINAVFSIYDTDADDFITWDDLTAIATQICEQLDIVGSPQATAMLDSYASVWEQLRADCDADGDGRIGRAEFTQALLSGGGDPQEYYNQHLAEIMGLFAEAMDTDGDGFIEQAEYQAFFRVAHDVDPQAILAGFARLDADGDGRISRAEFTTGGSHVFLSNDPAHPGTSILGQA